MVHHSLFFALFLAFSLPGFSQDERYYRHILSGDLQKYTLEHREVMVTQFNVQGTSYKFDLNGDGIEEILQPQKRDGVDWLEIKDSSQRKIFEAKLVGNGADSAIYKIKLVHLTPKVKAAILFFDEGYTKARRFESTAKIYVISFENNDLSNAAIAEGPHFFHEREAQREQYWRRDYNVNVYDVDGDGQREIAIMYNHIQRIMKYRGRGEWERF